MNIANEMWGIKEQINNVCKLARLFTILTKYSVNTELNNQPGKLI